MLFIFYLFSVIVAIQCIGSSEVPSTVYVGFINDDDKTQSHKESALVILNWYKDWLNQWSGRQSFKGVHGEVTGFMWVGSMVQYSGFSSNIITDFINEIETSLMPIEIYYEFLHTNALQTFGIILTTRSLNKAQTAVKKWSHGVSYGESRGSKNSNMLSICYLDYGNKKEETNDKEAGECFYKLIGLNELPSGNAGEYLSAFNPSLDFTKLQVDQPYCYSEGVLPNFKPAISSDGKCNTYRVGRGDTCSSITSSFYPLTVEDIEKYNKDVYGWGGCKRLFYGTKICLSEGIKLLFMDIKCFFENTLHQIVTACL